MGPVVGRSMPTASTEPVHAEVITAPAAAATDDVAEGVVTEAPTGHPIKKHHANKGRKTA